MQNIIVHVLAKSLVRKEAKNFVDMGHRSIQKSAT